VSDIIDEYFEFDFILNRQMNGRVKRGKYSIHKLPPLTLLLDLIDDFPTSDFDREDYEDGRGYIESVRFLNVVLSGAVDGRSIRLVRSYQMDSLEIVSGMIDGGNHVGIYWSTRETRTGLVDTFHGCPVSPGSNFVTLSARFDVNCIDVVKTMLANMIWGVKHEAEVRMFEGCVGEAIGATLYDRGWDLIDEMHLDGKRIVT